MPLLGYKRKKKTRLISQSTKSSIFALHSTGLLFVLFAHVQRHRVVRAIVGNRVAMRVKLHYTTTVNIPP